MKSHRNFDYAGMFDDAAAISKENEATAAAFEARMKAQRETPVVFCEYCGQSIPQATGENDDYCANCQEQHIATVATPFKVLFQMVAINAAIDFATDEQDALDEAAAIAYCERVDVAEKGMAKAFNAYLAMKVKCENATYRIMEGGAWKLSNMRGDLARALSLYVDAKASH